MCKNDFYVTDIFVLAKIALLPDYDKELAEKNIDLAEANKEPGQLIVYVRVEKLRASRIEGLTLQMA